MSLDHKLRFCSLPDLPREFLIRSERSIVVAGTPCSRPSRQLASFGAFIGLQHDIDGLVHISQISEERVDKIKNVLKVNLEVTARMITIDNEQRRIGLSMKSHLLELRRSCVHFPAFLLS